MVQVCAVCLSSLYDQYHCRKLDQSWVMRSEKTRTCCCVVSSMSQAVAIQGVSVTSKCSPLPWAGLLSLSEAHANADHCTSPWQRGQTYPGPTMASTSLWRGTAARILPAVTWPELVFSINATPLWRGSSSIQMRTNNKITNSSKRQCLGRKLSCYRIDLKNNISVKVKNK